MGKRKDESPGVMTSFAGGLICTLLLVVAVPVICSHYVQPAVENVVGNNTFMWLSSSLIVAIIMLVVMVLFMLLLGGGAIFRRYGAIGVIALIAAYWLLGDVRQAFFPVLIIIVMYLLGFGKK